MILGIDPSLTATGLSDGFRHEIIGTTPIVAHTPTQGTMQRCDRIAEFAFAFMGVDSTDGHLVVIEAPMVGPSANHLYEVGILMSALYRILLPVAEIIEVPPSTLKKFATGKGNTPKDQMALKVYKRWGIEFVNDRGADKLHAFCLYKYGVAVQSGEIAHTVSERRGCGGRKAA